MYLSHLISGMDALEPVFVFIWNLVHGRGVTGEENLDILVQSVQSAMYPLLTMEDLKTIQELDSNTVEDIWDALVKAEVLDEEGKILKVEELKNSKKVLQHDFQHRGKILNLLKDTIRKGVTIPISQDLLKFVELHLQEWIKNAMLARLMTLNEDYIIDIDRSENAVRSRPNIIIMDNQTGVEQYHSQWSNGLHQFLQMKHACRLSMESLKAVFVSNVTFFKRYGKQVFGLSGTLGSEFEKKFLETIYDTAFAIIPTFKQSRFIEEVPKLTNNEEAWKQTITKQALDKAKRRPVLVICENVATVEKLEEVFAKTDAKLQIYKRSYEPLLGAEEEICEPCLILATNLAGRGTDLKISEKMSDEGGLHVIISYLPESVRIEEQAFGRSARKGQKGSGEIICMNTEHFEQSSSNLDAIIEMKIKRNLKEAKHVSAIQQSFLNNIKPEEDLFAEFQIVYRNLGYELDVLGKEINFAADIIKQNVLDNWAFWLDEVNVLYEDSLKKISAKKFLEKIKSAIGKKSVEGFLDLIDKPAYKIKVAKYFIDKKNWSQAETFLQSVIANDEFFKPIAYYYMAHLLIRREKPKVRSDCPQMFEYLGLARKGFEDQMQVQSQFNSTISFIAKNYMEQSKQSFLLVNDFEAQTKDIIDLYNVYLRSIDDILGTEPSGHMLETEKVDLITASKLMSLLKSKGQIVSAKVLKTDCSELKSKYESYYSDVRKVLSRKLEQPSLSRTNFEAVLKVLNWEKQLSNISIEDLKGILPSREHFWKECVQLGIIQNEQKLIIIDIEQVKEKYDALQWSKLKDLINFNPSNSKNWFENVWLVQKNEDGTVSQNTVDSSKGMKKVCLYPQMIEDVKNKKDNLKVLTIEEFENNFGSLDLWNSLLMKNILMENSVGSLSQVKKSLKSFSGISASTFDHYPRLSGQKVRKYLKSQKVIKTLDNGKLMLDEGIFSKDEWCNDDEIAEFKTEIVNLVSTSFGYQIALKELKDFGDVSLPSRSEDELWEDLMTHNCIEPSKIKDTEDESSLRKSIEELIDVNREMFMYFFTKKKDEEKDQMVKNVVDSLHGTKSGLLALDTSDSSLKPLADYLTPEDVYKKGTELQQFSNNALGHTVVLTEQK